MREPVPLLEHQIQSLRAEQPYNVFFPAALAFLHLARAAAANFALVAGLLRRSFFLAGLDLAFVPFNMAARIFRALARALISLRRWAAVM